MQEATAAMEVTEEAAREAAEYDAWFRRKVQEALDEVEFLTAEEMEAEAEAWCIQTLRQAGGVVDEVGMEVLSEG